MQQYALHIWYVVFTYSASGSKSCWTRIEYCMKAGAHRDRDPATKATQVKPADDRMKLLLQNKDWKQLLFIFEMSHSNEEIRFAI